MVNIELDYYKLLQISSGLRLLLSDMAKRGTQVSIIKDIVTLTDQFETLAKQEEPK